MKISRFHISKDANWLDGILSELETSGCAILEGVLDASFLKETRTRMYAVQQAIWKKIGEEKLRAAGELGVLRLMMRYDPFFVRFLEFDPILKVLDRFLSPTAIMHLQNGFILPSFQSNEDIKTHQNTFHRDFPFYLKSYRASINFLFSVDSFNALNGATLVVPGSHQQEELPTKESLEGSVIAAECPPGSAVVFDSTLWHAAGINRSGKDRLAVNMQFTRSILKQQLDYVRGIGDEIILRQAPRTQQLLGYYTRLPSTLEEYYVPEQERRYRKGQG